ncbi:hypothetical protein OX284_004150 [Flavobacterium sp. SUN046]|uniref:hypothetical protein n=1 Tax=Flavobacterium sp. SUN046 TaxID=3002440 RepID=UPI002DBEA29C|nr:hypothetical protein [Flavobacterium sp. SUN046]MEC4048610.1 hypothetical protein [Flavobacterium sp. SUN046]
MKKGFILYSTIVYLICFFPSLMSLTQLDFKFNTVFFFIYSFLGLLAIYFISKDKFIKESFTYLSLSNFLQMFSFVLLGLSYKFVLGPSLFFYISDTGDLVTQFSFKFYNIIFHINKVESDGNFLIGINLFNLFLFLGFASLANKHLHSKSALNSNIEDNNN